MYRFIDVNEASEDVLPSEALQINGEYIENLIPGYRTLNVKGREALSPDVTTFETGLRDGTRIKNKRYPERIITVKYLLKAASNEEFRNAYNELGRILNVDNAELIFADESDKFYLGTPCIIGSVEPGRNFVVGEFEILCADPFKYSLMEYTATADIEENSVLLDYNGTYKAYPKLEARFTAESETDDDGNDTALTGAGDCGFVAFYNENAKIIQLGDPDEVDGIANAYSQAQTLIRSDFRNSSSSKYTAEAKKWAVNNGIVIHDVIQGGFTKAGTFKQAGADYEENPKTNTTATLLKVRSTANAPAIDYVVKAKAYGRTDTTVKVILSISASLGAKSSYFLGGYILKAGIYINGSWVEFVLKQSSDKWRGTDANITTKAITITGLTPTTASLTGIKFKAYRGDNNGTAGILSATACSNLAIPTATAGTPLRYYITPGSFTSKDGWHGATLCRTIPADAAGDVGAKNWLFEFANKMSIGSGTKAGLTPSGYFNASVLYNDNGTRKILAGISLYCKGKSSKVSYSLVINNKMVKSGTLSNPNASGYYNSHTKTNKITKTGKTILFSLPTGTVTCNAAAMENVLATEVCFVMGMYGKTTQYTPLAYNGLYFANFTKRNCDTWKEIKNKFKSNDILQADCSNGLVYLNGVESPELGAAGNDWEDFYLKPGFNQIGFSFSDWVETENAPKISVKYREVFL